MISCSLIWIIFFTWLSTQFLLVIKCFKSCAKKLEKYKKANKKNNSVEVKNEKPADINSKEVERAKVDIETIPQPNDKRTNEIRKSFEGKHESKKIAVTKPNDDKAPSTFKDIEDDTLRNLPSLVYDGNDTSTS
ncbi:unnamed protein product [Auanema sp. JU1783]|nr:unnamed protein product [Auanema sp. JU1783]